MRVQLQELKKTARGLDGLKVRVPQALIDPISPSLPHSPTAPLPHSPTAPPPHSPPEPFELKTPLSAPLRSLRAFRVLSLLAFAALAGCSTTAPVDYARPYPKELPPGPVLDVQVFRRDKTLEFTNTTGASLGPGTLWLNRRFSRPIKEPIGVGQSVAIPLTEFRDEFGDPFKPGGFWATENPDSVALCQLEITPEGQQPQMIGLVTVQSVADN